MNASSHIELLAGRVTANILGNVQYLLALAMAANRAVTLLRPVTHVAVSLLSNSGSWIGPDLDRPSHSKHCLGLLALPTLIQPDHIHHFVLISWRRSDRIRK